MARRVRLRAGPGIVAGVAAALMLVVPATRLAAAAPEGRWAVHAGGHVMMIVEIHRSAAGGWTGSLTAPRHYELGGQGVFSAVQGPPSRRSIRGIHPASGGYDLIVDSARPAEAPDLLTLRIGAAGKAEIAFKDFPIEPLPLVPAAAGEKVAARWAPGRVFAVERHFATNDEMTRIFAADQAARQSAQIDWTILSGQDEQRRLRTKALLDGGALASGDDFYHAAFMFQHGDAPADYLLAHTLAIAAVARGRPDATWIASATLDRYLQSIGQKQVYGTQFRIPKGQPATQEPYDRDLVSDALRRLLAVPSRAEQEVTRKGYDSEQAQPAPH